MAQPSARDRILDTAKRLFYRDGFRATGIDRIVAESGVAKMSLYRHFASKDDLIAAFLDWRHEHWTAWFTAAVDARLARGEGLAAVADVLGEWFGQDDFRGCAFINAVAETGATDDPRHRDQAVRHKRDLERYLATAAARLGLGTPERVAEEAMLCVEGMIVRAQMGFDLRIVDAGRRLLARVERDAGG
ncbi:TetR/AcrR family transcriptional regulator [Massilia rhizosphaerae]|uniref:TetR/AcrR family transcriptional regulator n=1 Tax=Massilia rhizosphaerae TaxID=2784389 RepID=UPI0018DC7D43|nr:TetR/AcrR family transcriptional regulator [Massilia rhizosphaerae]